VVLRIGHCSNEVVMRALRSFFQSAFEETGVVRHALPRSELDRTAKCQYIGQCDLLTVTDVFFAIPQVMRPFAVSGADFVVID